MNQHFVREADRDRHHDARQRPHGRHRAHARHRDRDARRLGRRGLAQRARRTSTASRTSSSTWPSRARAGAPPARSPRTSRMSAARSTPRPASNTRATRRASSARTSDVALDVLGDILTNSSFDESELAREKGVILQEYAAVEDTPDDLVYDAFMETAFAGQAIGRPILGTPETIKSLRRRHDPGLHGARIRARAHGARRRRRRGPRRHRRRGRAPFRRHAGRRRARRRDRRPIPAASGACRAGSNRRTSCSACRACSFKDPVYYATHLFAHVLGGGLTSRLWHEVRETRGLAYSIDAFHWPFSDCGLFGIGAGTAGSDVAELVEVTLDCARAGRARHRARSRSPAPRRR